MWGLPNHLPGVLDPACEANSAQQVLHTSQWKRKQEDLRVVVVLVNANEIEDYIYYAHENWGVDPKSKHKHLLE